jgi:hypothetical protein
MRKFTAAAALFAVGLAGYQATQPVTVSTAGHNRPVAHRRTPSRGMLIGRESLAAVNAAGTVWARVTETGAGESVTATSWLRLPGGPATPATVPAADAAEIVVTPDAERLRLAADPATIDRLRRVLDPRAAAALFAVASDVRRMGPARVSGQVAVRYRLSVELAPHPDLDRTMAEEVGALRRAGLSMVTTDVWLDQAKRPVRVTLTAAEPGGEPGRSIDCRYYDWGAAAGA